MSVIGSAGIRSIVALSMSLAFGCSSQPPSASIHDPTLPDGGAVTNGGPVPDAMPTDAGAPVFGTTLMHQVKITVDPDVWQAFVDEHAQVPPTTRDWRPTAITIDGENFDQVGFRDFGDGSRSASPYKPSLRVRFNKYVPGEAFGGHTDLKFKNSGEDPSFLREPLTFEAMRAAGIPAPRTAYAQITVNGDSYGLYEMFEPITKTFAYTNFGNSGGTIYEPIGCHGLMPTTSGGCAGLINKYNRPFNETLGAGEDLAALCEAANGGTPDTLADSLSQLIDLDEALRLIAADTAIFGDFDNFEGAGANFYLYHNTATNKFVVIGSGTDTSMAPDLMVDPLNPPIVPWCATYNYRDPILTRLMSVPSGQARYKETIQNLRRGPMAADTLIRRANEIWNTISVAAYADPVKAYANFDVTGSKDDLIGFIRDRDTLLTNLLGPP